jgi:microcystin-dependent protein
MSCGGCGCCATCVSGLINQQLGEAYENIRIVAENISALLVLSVQLSSSANVLNLLRGTTANISSGEITGDVDNSYIAVAPEAGLTDDITTVNTVSNGRVLLMRPQSILQTITLKPPIVKEITSFDPIMDTVTVPAHGLVAGQQFNLRGDDLPSGIPEGYYYAIVTDANTIQIASTRALALAGTEIDITENGDGQLYIGNLNITEDLILGGQDTVMLVRDGPMYAVLSTTGMSPTVNEAIQEVLANSQPLHANLTALASLVLAGNPGEVIQVNGTANGFELVNLNLTGLLAGKSDVGHTHDAADLPDLTAAFAAKQDLDADLTAIAALTTTVYGRSLLTLADQAALVAEAGGGGGGGTSVPAGTVIMRATGDTPAGYLKCDGAAVSRVTYADLHTAIGNWFGEGDGVTTFNVPELRGEFVRGWDDGRGVDPGRYFGSAQAEAVGDHSHSLGISAFSQIAHDGSTEGDRTVQAPGTALNGYIGSSGGTETRPRNVALAYFIKT